MSPAAPVRGMLKSIDSARLMRYAVCVWQA